MKLLQHMILGVLISLSMSYTIVTIRVLKVDGRLISGSDLSQELVIAFALGLVIGAATLILHSERLPFPLLVAIHFIVVQCTVFTVGGFAGWYDFTAASIVYMFFVIVIVYIITWTIVVMLEKRDVEKINALLHKRR